MKLRIAFLAFALAAPLGGCTTFGALVGGASVAQTAPTVTMTVEKGLTISNLALQGAGTLLISGAQSGVLHGANAASAKALYDKADDALSAAKAADEAANAQGVADAVTKADDFLAQVNALAAPK